MFNSYKYVSSGA